jgi:1-acyl-sn-glycerol-3-phosphate acyltransferase
LSNNFCLPGYAKRALIPSDDPTRLKPQIYVDPRPAHYFDRFHARARTREPDWVYSFIKTVSYPYCRLAYRLHANGLERVPREGPVILAPNHFSAMDHWFVGILLPRQVRFMAKSQLFKGPFLEFIMAHSGAFPVRRGQHDEQAITTALTILRRDGVLVIYPEGGRSRSGQIGASARPGVGRLALESAAPVVPVALSGSEKARNWRRLDFPAVTVAYGQPLHFGAEPGAGRERQQEVADQVLKAVRSEYELLKRAAR